jgi:hypothetical protein
MNLWSVVALTGVVVLACAAWCRAADTAGVIFSWTPGTPTARTATGEARMQADAKAEAAECPVGAALWAGKDGAIGGGEVTLGKIPDTGTIRFWLRLDREIRVCPAGGRVSGRLIHCEDLSIHLRENDNGCTINVEGGNEIRRPRVRGLASFDLTHLRAGQWYHVAIHYDAPKGAWRLILNGVLQPKPWFFGPFRWRHLSTKIALSGRMQPLRGKGAPARIALGPVTWHDGTVEAADVAAKLKALKGWKVPPNRGEGVLEKAAAFDGEALGGEVLYRNDFDKPLDMNEWVLEGPAKLKIHDGRLEVHNNQHCVLWLKRKLPRDFVAAWDCAPSQVKGLTICFLAAMGAKGEDLFDPALARRDGDFSQYIRGDIRSYHCSYYAGARGSANMRKNPGFYMVGMGPDLIGPAMLAGRKGPFRVVVVRRGNRIECAVDKKRFLVFEDDGRKYGPAHGAGYFGLRQMGHSKRVAYDNLVIRAIQAPQTP